MEKKRAELLRRMAAISDVIITDEEEEKKEEVVTAPPPHPNIESKTSDPSAASPSFADIVKALEKVKFITPG